MLRCCFQNRSGERETRPQNRMDHSKIFAATQAQPSNLRRREALVGLLGSGRSLWSTPRKAFCVAVVVAIALSATAATSLSFAQETVAQAYSQGSARLDHEESVNLYGR